MIKIEKNIVKSIATRAKEELPEEICGYLGGTPEHLSREYVLENVDHSPEHFSFDPKEQFAVVKQARAEGLKLAAVYHSHPETPARMSQEDIRLANDPNTLYLIYSVSDDDLKAFSVEISGDDKKVIPREIAFVQE